MKRQSVTKRILSLVLSLTLLLGLLPGLPVSAADTGGISTYLSNVGFKGKTISILGDSISTFENYSNGTAADTTNSTIRSNAVYYKTSTVSTYGVDVGDTWWQQTADVLGMRVLVNNSWSGSRVINFTDGTGSGYVGRCQNLHDNTGSNSGETPDIIAIYLGTNDTKNADDPGDVTQVDYTALKSVSSSYTPSTVFEAYALMVQRAIAKYPDAEIYCMTLIPYENITTAQKTVLLEFNAGVKTIAAHYGVYVADLYEESGLTSQSENFDYHMANRLHPGPYGMDAITNCLVNAMLENSQYNTAATNLQPITYDLDGVYAKGGTIQNALTGKALTIGFGAREGYDLDLTVTMSGTDITDSCYADGTLTIPSVTGPVTIKGRCILADKDPEIYRWEMNSNHLLSVNDEGAVYNGATLIAGSCTSSVFSTAQYNLDKPVILFHDRPWVIQWKSTGNFTNGMLMLSGNQNGKAEGNTYIFRKPGSSLIAIGYSDGASYYNYGLDLSDHSIDGTVSHTYTLVNKISSDGSNMPWLYVDNKPLGEMNNYYLGGTDKNTTSDWLSGQDLVFNCMGTEGHPLNDGTINHLQIWENGAPEELRRYNYRWETTNGSFICVTGDDLTENTATQLQGSIAADGKLTGSCFKTEEPIVLLHDEPWSLEWSSSGTWKDSANGAFLLSASDTTNAVNGAYLYRRGASELIAFGERADGVHNNYGISLADHGIDGSAQHTYRLTNRVDGDGTNMVYLYVDGVEIGAMNNYFSGGTAQGTTSDWLSGRDLTFTHIGTPQFRIGNCYLQYLQVWEKGIEAASYRWEMQNDQLTDITTDEFTQNDLTVLAGSVSSGTLSDSRFQLNEPVTLRHDRPWSMEWTSTGTWKDSSNGAIFFSTSTTSTTDGTFYLYRRSGSSLIALGHRSNSKHNNYGINLADYGIDGTAEHTYRLENRINGDGTNMVWLLVDGVELGAMNNYYISTTLQGTDNWVSGKDFVFTYMGTTDFPIGNCNLKDLQIHEAEDLPNTYRWETQNDVLTSVTGDGLTENTAAIQAGSITDGTYTDSYFALDRTVVLLHDKPWVMEWESEGSWSNSSGGALLFARNPVSGTEGNVFLYRRKNSTFFGLGTYTDGKYHNYGLTLSDYGIDGTAKHVYRLTNRLFGDSNMIYLSVDGVEIGPLNGYYLGGTAQGTTSDWLSGQNLSFSYFGTQGHTISNCSLTYLQIWEDGLEPQNYRWETQSDVLTDVETGSFGANEATLLSGSISDGLFSDAQFKLEKSVTLRHDELWVIRWQSEGTWKDSSNGALLLASHAERTEGMVYLYRRGGSDIIGLGTDASGYKNYGIKLSNYGIDGTVKHEYVLENRIRSDGSNMVWLLVDGQEVGPLEYTYPSANETFTKSDWVSGKDFTFSYIGQTNFYVGNCTIDYLQISEAGESYASVLFKDWDGTLLSQQTVPVGQLPTAPEVPGKASDREYSYRFSGWTPEVTLAEGDAEYTAVYTATAHSFTEELTQAPGCTDTGLRTYACACGYSYTETVPALGHSYQTMTTAPGCTEDGYTTYTCALCGDSYVSDEVSATGHAYETVQVDATCEQDGSITSTCSNCGDVQTETLPATGHSYENGTCTVCGAADPDYVVVPTAYYLVGYINGADYGCEGDYENMGQYKFVDGKLTATFDSDSYVFLKGEGNVAWYMTSAYCQETTGTFYNTNTGAAEKMFVPGGVEVTFTLTENADGSLTLSYVTAASTVPTLSLSFPTLTFEDMISMNVYFTATDISDVVEMGMITYSSAVTEYSVETAEKVIPGYTWSDTYQMYVVSTGPIAAKDMSDEIFFAVYAKMADGTCTYSALVSYSPTDYAYDQLTTGSESVKNLMVAMLNYGAEAQTFFGYRTDALMNASLTDEQKASIETYRSDMMDTVSAVDATKAANFTRTSTGFTSRYPSISFEGAFQINYYCVPSAGPAGDITLYYWNQTDCDASEVLSVDNATGAIPMTEGTDRYEAAVTGIAAKELDKGVYVAFVYTDGTTEYCSGILGYSIGAYCVDQAATDAAIAPFAQATAVYGYYAKQLFIN